MSRSSFRLLGAAAVIAAAALLPGCALFEDEMKALEVFTVVMCVSAALNFLLIVLLVLYFLPFTRPIRKKRRKR